MDSDLSDLGTAGSQNLGSLAQSARLKNLITARWILIAIGVLTIVVNGIHVIGLRDETRDQFNKMVDVQKAKARARGMQFIVDQAKLDRAVDSELRVRYLIDYTAIALGVLFVLFGVIIKRYPLPITIISLILYLGATAVSAYLASENRYAGFFVKIIVIVALAKAVQSAIAYESERRVAAS